MAGPRNYSEAAAEPTRAVPFCLPDYVGTEVQNLQAAIAHGRLEGGGPFTRSCEAMLADITCSTAAMVVPSCTAALEMIALLLDIGPGDEVIMPDYTFVSTANAIALRGGVPVFVDIDPSTLNIDPDAAESAITSRTKALLPVHYAGVPCDMDRLGALSAEYGIALVEDAAQALGSSWNGRPAGGMGAMGAVSFHHTKNVTCGEGGALLINDAALVRPAEHIRDKGTDRAEFLRGDVQKYEWRVLGSSYLLSELAAAVLEAQLCRMETLLTKRMALWQAYEAVLGPIPDVRTPQVPPRATHNAHIYHLRLPDRGHRDAFIAAMGTAGVTVAPHYVPLHATPGGRRYGRAHGSMSVTFDAADTLVRLPLFSAMSQAEHAHVLEASLEALAAQGLGSP